MGNCVHYTYGMSGFEEKLNIPNSKNSKGNCVHYLCTACLDLQKNWMSKTAEIQWEIVYNIYVRNIWISRKNWISKTPKIQREIVYIIYVRNGWICSKIECLELQKFNGKFWTLYVWNVWICKKIEYPELRKFNGKLCTIYMYGM